MLFQVVMEAMLRAALVVMSLLPEVERVWGQRAPCYECEVYKDSHPQSRPYEEVSQQLTLFCVSDVRITETLETTVCRVMTPCSIGRYLTRFRGNLLQDFSGYLQNVCRLYGITSWKALKKEAVGSSEMLVNIYCIHMTS
jgi:hypothetical protein